ncbi:hypothetical protein ACIQVK_22105 [Streptomyces sp. NPDC090493]|uniref:hypothetical protein n=1 Tax=Streptomyces sp. NPDC090493 TaxID=3365964 RepID=UPI003810C9B4
MKMKMSRGLLVSAFLSASLALGAAPSYAQMAPSDAGISDSDWAEYLALGDLNGAFTEYVADDGGVVLVFTGGNVPTQLQYPEGWTYPDRALYGEYSQFASNAEVPAIEDDAVTQISDAGYDVSAGYDNDTDQVDVTSSAPSSVTDPLIATYGSKIHIIDGTPASQQSGSGGTAHGCAKTHKHAPRKAAKKAAKKASAPVPASPKVTKVLLVPGNSH